MTTKTKLIERSWQTYRAAFLPANACARHEADMRQAYFAGASVLFKAILGALEPGEEPTDADLSLFDRIHEEVEAFGQELDLRYLTGGRA